MELGPNQRKWLDALRSGNYEQGVGHLCKDNKFCCLGVACEVFEVPKRGTGSDGIVIYEDTSNSGTTTVAPPKVFYALALHSEVGGIAFFERSSFGPYQSLASVNDSGKFTFSQIADMIEANPSSVFEAPR